MKDPSKKLLNFFLRELFNRFSAQVYWLDSQGILLGCNKRFCRFVGQFSKNKLIGELYKDVVAKLELQIRDKKLNTSKSRAVYERTYELGGASYQFRVTNIFCFGISIFIEEDDSCYLSKIRDLKRQVSDLKRREEETNAYLNNVIKIVPASIYWKDRNSVILGSNLYHSKLAGFSNPVDVIGKTEHDFAWKKQAKEIIQNDKKIMKLGKGVRLEETGTLVDGKEHTFLTSKEPLRDKDNRVIGIIGISIDISEQKDAENRAKRAEAKALLLAKSQADSEVQIRKTLMVLVGDIVHDLRTPIATVRSTGDIISGLFKELKPVLDEARANDSKEINGISKRKLQALYDATLTTAIANSVKMMDEFINSSLKELRNAQKAIDASLVKEDLVKCSSRRILENTLDAFIFSSDIKVNLNVSYDFDLMGNTILIMKVLFNLLKNAVEQIHAKNQGEIFIETSAAKYANLIKVKDTAGGAEPEVEAELFKGYFTTKKEGTGIGLASCEKVMKSLGGNISVLNKYGDSIEFILSFPKVKG